MSTLGASRFTALLAAVAISGMAGAFWWALETRSGIKAAAGHRGMVRAVPKFPGRVTSANGERPPAKLESGKFELMGKSEQLQPFTSGRSNDQEAAPILANYPNVTIGPSPSPSPVPAPNSGLQRSDFQNHEIPTFPVPRPENPDAQSPATPGSRADMPLPALPPAQPDPAPPPIASWQSKFLEQSFLIPPARVAPQPAEAPKRQTRSASAARVPKPSAPSYYMEKYLDQGEYHLRRRPCEPPNMPDVCFMPQADRQPILVSKP